MCLMIAKCKRFSKYFKALRDPLILNVFAHNHTLPTTRGGILILLDFVNSIHNI